MNDWPDMRTDEQALRLLIARIEHRLSETGLSAAEASKKAGLGRSAISDIKNGKNKRPSIPTITGLARALGCTVGYLTGEESRSSRSTELQEFLLIPIVAVAETGAFRQMIDFSVSFPGDLPTELSRPNQRYPDARHFALRVVGDSMNQARPFPILEGMLALCVDFQDAGLDVETGRIYALRRTRDGGQTYECSIKRAHVFRDRYEFRPESSRPHEAIVISRTGIIPDDGTTIDVIGLVYATHQNLDF